MKQRIVLFTHPSCYSSVIFHELSACNNIDIVGIVASTCIMRRGVHPLFDIFRLLRVSGLRYALATATSTMLFELFHPSQKLSRLAKQANIPILRTNDVNTSMVKTFMDELNPDYGVSAYFNQLLKPMIYTHPRKGMINIHPSVLPHNKGVDPMFYTRLRQEGMIGVTIHTIVKQLDEGQILGQQQFPDDLEKTVLSQYTHLFKLGAQLVVQYLQSPQALASASQGNVGNYDGWPKKAQMAKALHYGRVVDLPTLISDYHRLISQTPQNREVTT